MATEPRCTKCEKEFLGPFNLRKFSVHLLSTIQFYLITSSTGSRESRALRSARERKTELRTFRKSEVRELVLIGYGEVLKKGSIWPAFKTIIYGPCRVVAASHQR